MIAESGSFLSNEFSLPRNGLVVDPANGHTSWSQFLESNKATGYKVIQAAEIF